MSNAIDDEVDDEAAMSKAEIQFRLDENKNVRSFYESPAYSYVWRIAEEQMKVHDQTALTTDPVVHAADIARAQGAIKALQDLFADIQSVSRGDLLPEEEEVKPNRKRRAREVGTV